MNPHCMDLVAAKIRATRTMPFHKKAILCCESLDDEGSLSGLVRPAFGTKRAATVVDLRG